MKTVRILLVLVLNFGISTVNAWDVAVAVGKVVHFLNTSGEVEGELSEGMSEVRALAFNSELRRMYFGDNEMSNGSIFEVVVPQSFASTNSTTSATIHTVVSKLVHQVKGLAYDDMTGILYWSNGPGHAIMWVRVQTNDQPQAGQPLLHVDGQIPMGMAIDTCKRYLYWTNCGKTPSIERSQLDGSGRQTLVTEGLKLPYAVVVDQTTDRIYWVDEQPGTQFRLESSDLDGKDRKVLIEGSDHQPFSLAVGNGNVFWADHIHKSVWRLPLDTPHSSNTHEPILVSLYRNSPLALVSARSRVWTRDRCNPVKEPIMKVIPAIVTKTAVEKPLAQKVNASHMSCLNQGIWLTEVGYCDCLPGYSGVLCEVDECLDYCVHGTCQAGEDGRSCQCYEGYMGTRCEVSACHNYCVTGTCSIDLTGQPQCHCREGYSGQRCEVNFTQQQELKDDLKEVCSAFCKLWAKSSEENIQPFDVCRCTEYEAMPPLDSEWSRDYMLVALLALCSILMVLVAVLTKKVLVLRKRPRIKKRIIVNKTTTPLTCRPSPTGGEQCEITIENCCNMNICETPCFEPDFRQPQATLSKANNKGAKEEKKTLLGNMELPPDDLY